MSDNNIILGDVANVAASEYEPALAGKGEETVVAVFNPLPYDFRVAFARPTAYTPTGDPNRDFASSKAGLDLTKTGPGSRNYVTQDVILPGGQIKNLPGDIAQLAVRKLITAIIQTRNDDGSYNFDGRGGHKGMVPDPFLRQQIENEIIKGVYSAVDFFNQRSEVRSTEQRTQSQIDAMNDPTRGGNGTSGQDTPEPAVPASAGQPDTAQSGPAQKAGPAAKSK